MPLPVVGGTLVKDVDPGTFGLANGTALTFANSGLTPVTASPTLRTNVFDTGAPAIWCVLSASGFSIARPVQDDFTLYCVVKDVFGSVTGSGQYWQASSLIDCDAPFSVNDFGINLRNDGKLCAGTGNPDTSGTGSAILTPDTGTHILAVTRVKATGVLKVYVDNVLDITVTNNVNSLSAAANISFGMGPANGDVGGYYGRFLAYDAAHSNADRLSVTSYLTTTYGEAAWLRSTKSQTYGVLGPPLTLSSTKSVMYVITGPGVLPHPQRIRVSLVCRTRAAG
jgi:hypothetical protein